MTRRRLDAEMVRRDLARSRADAQRLILDEKVIVKGMPTPKPASLIDADTPVDLVTTEKRWVSRGAFKMRAGLEVFPVDVNGKAALDVGSSTGGFTEVLLDAGVASVIALDVGRGQLHESLRADPRVTSMERTNFRLVDVARIGGPREVVVADLSFISLCTVASKLAEACSPDGDLIVLVKPQFEAGKRDVPRGGVIRDPEVRRQAVIGVIECLADAGIGARGVIRSPIEGGDGNVEYLLWLRHGPSDAVLEVPL
ncbi:MAG: TlyA family RNA methyltransferase [Acidimicrobiia bacterium]